MVASAVKTLAAFQRQIEQLCELTWRELPDPADVEALRAEVAAARAMRGKLLEAPLRVAHCASRFLRVLNAADDELSPEDVAQLDAYVQDSLSRERPPHPKPTRLA